MIEMARRFLRQKFGSPATVVALCLLALVACLPLNAGQQFGSIDTLAVLVLASGAVSRDASSGALQMILARPIRRSEYLAGRYLGILAAVAAFLLGTVLLAAALNAAIASLTPGPASHVFSFQAAGLAACHAFLAAALLAAILVFLSTFLRGWGDVLAVVLVFLLFNSMQGLGNALNLPLLARAGAVARENLAPSVPWPAPAGEGGLLSEATGRYVLALALSWALAVVVFSRREFSYGQE